MKNIYFFLHNFIAHPLLCFDNRKSSLPGRFHDWTWRKYMSCPEMKLKDIKTSLSELPRYYVTEQGDYSVCARREKHPYGQWISVSDLNNIINEI